MNESLLNAVLLAYLGTPRTVVILAIWEYFSRQIVNDFFFL